MGAELEHASAHCPAADPGEGEGQEDQKRYYPLHREPRGGPTTAGQASERQTGARADRSIMLSEYHRGADSTTGTGNVLTHRSDLC